MGRLARGADDGFLALTLGRPQAAPELVQGAGPVALEQARERPVRKEPAAGLARRAVVDLVLGVDDALHRRAADGAGFPVPAVHGHAFAEGRDLLREGVAGLLAQPLGPLAKHLLRGVVEAA